MKKLPNIIIFGGIVLLLHGLTELLPALFLFQKLPSNFQIFIFPELANNWQMAIVIGVIFGLLRILAGIGILRNRYWGWILGATLSIVTLAMLFILLPSGIIDGLFSGGALVLLIIGKYGKTEIL